MKKQIKVFAVFIAIAMILGVTACGSDKETDVKQAEEKTATKYEVNINVDCIRNVFFSKYDVRVLLNDITELGIIEHGKSGQYNTELEKGEYELHVENEEDSSVDGTIKFEISGDTELKYKVSCSSDQIEIEEVKRVNPPITSEGLGKLKSKNAVKQFENAGFNNIKVEKICDLTEEQLTEKSVVEEMLIDGKAEYSKSDIFFENSKVVIKHHAPKQISPPRGEASCEGKNYKNIVEEFKNAGFKNVKSKETDAFDESDAEKVESVKIGSQYSFN